MAIANAIGSNVFNILLGLGGPWLASSLVSGEPTAVSEAGGKASKEATRKITHVDAVPARNTKSAREAH